MAYLKGLGTPTATKYKGKVAIGQEQIQTKKVYGFYGKSMNVGEKDQKKNDKSKSPRPVTPIKINKINKE